MNTSSRVAGTGMQMGHRDARSFQPGRMRSMRPFAERHAQMQIFAKGVNVLHIRIIRDDLAGCHLSVRSQLQDASLQTLHQLTRRSLRQRRGHGS